PPPEPPAVAAVTPAPTDPEPAVPLAPPPRPSTASEVRAALERGKRDFEARDYPAALVAFDRAVALDPANWEGHFERGVVLVALRDFDAAMAALDRAVALRPAAWVPYYTRGVAAYDLKRDYARAAAEWTGAIDRGCPQPVVWLYRGECHQKLGDLDRALADFDEAIRRDRSLAAAYLKRGEVREDRRDYRAAADDFGRVIALTPGRTLAYGKRAWNRYLIGDWAGAAADWDIYLPANPGWSEGYRQRANARILSGDWAGAVADWDRAVGMGWAGEFDPEPERRFLAVVAAAARGDLAGYRDGCRAALREYRETTASRTAYVIGRLLSQCPGSGVDPDEAVRLAARGALGGGGWSLHALALARLRAGRPDEALRQAYRSLDPKAQWDDGDTRVLSWYVVALAELARGDRGAAVIAYRRVDRPPGVMHPHDVAGYVLLKREVEVALGLALPLAPEPRPVRKKGRP
ncbi:MAG: tetratricopeptide repeat protein, partial [Gemmataceae bacterium]|nr:tetratricopeptide repeat protein [Gemmataceae bacterium]